AGLNLVMAMLDDPFFKNKSILLLDKDPKVTNDHTWCYWESGKGKWDLIAHKIWEKGFFVSNEVKHQLDMNPYRYKMVRAADFYSYIKKRLEEAPNVKWVHEEVLEVVEEREVVITTPSNAMFARQVFDSRIAKEFYQHNDSSIRILQHFKGWVVETEEDFFNPEEFVMMDFRLKWKNSASFTYVLPSTKRSALIEFTLFTTELIEDTSYDAMLIKYCDEILKLKKYKIIEVEKGVIPMTDFPFHKYNTTKV
ncbi:MAG TPA: lycopene cyclase family protein, partial [Bacteroidia bacterium]|nr:lycopene cyclase family protein [Bacteroidia bacterium]